MIMMIDSFEMGFDEALKLIDELKVDEIVYCEQICSYIIFVKDGRHISFTHSQYGDLIDELLITGNEFKRLLEHFGIDADLMNCTIYSLDGSEPMKYDPLTGRKTALSD